MAALAHPFGAPMPSAKGRGRTSALRLVGAEPSEVVQLAPITPLGTRRQIEYEAEIEEARARARRLAERRRLRARQRAKRRLRALVSVTATVAGICALWFGGSALSSMHSPHLQVLAGSTPTSGGYMYRVQAGDTLWSIATRLDPQGDPRPIVDQLEAEVGGTSVQPGSLIKVP